MNSVFRREKIIMEESYRHSELKPPLWDYFKINPCHNETTKLASGLDHLHKEQAYHRALGIPFAVTVERDDLWIFWKHQNEALDIHDTRKNKQVRGKKVVCVCPLCEVEHKMLIDWRGRGVCPKFCPNCNAQYEFWSSGIDEQYEFHDLAISRGR